ncbi:calponin homology and LIM domain-containing protein-like [Contarinia nasturtii]|uniref:calponin homology and LIM domain-containing protein-like n=1 Tax=Contarinia nasturtii TaxID=265458 RepID=UPI0012D468CF|nr:calponin homology and LIM domain-containing protein-like [Contarinia nasturtii]XP_031624830.1 calponin homology and LIM domain-containing protein-like [Contarinia nasturtii]
MFKSLSNRIMFMHLTFLTFSISIYSVQGLQCYACSSDKLEDCSTLHSDEELPLELCSSEDRFCFTSIENGITTRGCLSSSKKRICSENSCSRCKSNKCNGEIFPEDRLICLHCSGSNCVSQGNSIDVRFPCVNYVPNDECYSIFSHDGKTAYRGCMSDTDQNKGECLGHVQQCHRCSNRACNANSLELEEKLSCIKCTPDGNSNCNILEDFTEAVECARTALGYKNRCYTHSKDGISHRGCLYEANTDIFKECSDENSERCFTCAEEGCNDTSIPDGTQSQ